MKFRLKAYYIYLISLVVLPLPFSYIRWVWLSDRPTENTLFENLGFELGWILIVGLMILGTYYSIKHEWKKWKKRTKTTLKDNLSAS